MKERIPKEGGELDLRFVERPNPDERHSETTRPLRILQWRRSIVAPKQPPQAKITMVPLLTWTPWEDVPVVKEDG